MTVDDLGLRWTIVHQDKGDPIEHQDKGDPIVRRYPVPGGWLYQVSINTMCLHGTSISRADWEYYVKTEATSHAPVFVPYVGPRTP